MLFARYKTCLALDDVPIRRIYDDAFWAFLFKLVVYQAKQNTPEKIYDYLLPCVPFSPSWSVLDPGSRSLFPT